MKLGVLTVPLQGMPAEEAFAYLHGLGVETVELGTGGYTNNNHLKPEVYLNDDRKIEEFKQLLKKNELTISVLSCHGNPVHPDKPRQTCIITCLWTPASWRRSWAWIPS